VLNDENLTFRRTLFGSKIIPWRDIDEFVVFSYRSAKSICYRYRAGRAPKDLNTRLQQKFGVDGHLGNGWPMPAEEMVALLNQHVRAAN
jgi:hypothetical protein